VTVARPRRWSTTLRSQPTSYIPKPSAGLCGYPVACQSLSFRFLRRDPSDGLLTGHAPGLCPDRIDKRRMCWPAKWLIFGAPAFAAAHDAAAFRQIGCSMWPRGSPHRTNERLVVNLLGRSKRRHRRATTFRSGNFSGTQIFESNLIEPCRYAREVAGTGRSTFAERLDGATELRLRPDEPGSWTFIAAFDFVLVLFYVGTRLATAQTRT